MALGRLFVNPRVTPLVSGAVSPSARLYFYRTGTSTELAVYSDSTLSTVHTQPITADASGVFAKIYLDPGAGYDYRVELRDSTDSLIWREDDVVAEHKNAAKFSESSFTGTLTGYASGPTGTVSYRIVQDSQGYGRVCTLRAASAISGTSNATSLTMTGLPAACQPASTALTTCVATDNGTSVVASASVSGSTITFATDAPFSASGWTNTGTKGLPAGWTISYPL